MEETLVSITRAIVRNIAAYQYSLAHITQEVFISIPPADGSLLAAYGHPRRVEFVRWYLRKCTENLAFLTFVLLTDETSFTCERNLNQHNVQCGSTATHKKCDQILASNISPQMGGNCSVQQ